MNVAQLSIIILVAPLIGFLINGLFGKKLGQQVVAIIGCSTIALAFVSAAYIFLQIVGGHMQPFIVPLFNFLNIGNLNIDIALQIDQLSILMMLIITGVGLLIHIYSIGYMHNDEGFHKFFAYLNLFVFSMLTLVMGASYVILFFGWEGVGLCSYLLIGFWFKNHAYNDAAKKAFIMNRIGDLGFLMGMFMLFSEVQSLDYRIVFSYNLLAIPAAKLTAICLLFFVGAIGKSAQLPLYTWLPDAMAGPTPVSALIHAATMVTAGIYMIVRSNVLFSLSQEALTIIGWVGLATALFAGTIALFQNDIKKVLAYSTVSQLGFMFIAIGVGAYSTAMFHLMTHAFFKALLFLGAGSVIHAMSGEQDITKMGGLRKNIKITYFTFLIGVLAIIGFPFTSGFISKDEILISVLQKNVWMFYLAVLAAVITVFYMLRLFWLVFFGKFRGSENQMSHLHESPVTITLPLIILAILSLLGGLIQLPHAFGGHSYLNSFLANIIPKSTESEQANVAIQEFYLLIGTIVALAFLGFFTFKKYTTDHFSGVYTGIAKILENKYYVDELYNYAIVRPFMFLSRQFYYVVDKTILGGAVFISGKSVDWLGTTLRYLQSGQTSWYAFLMVVGMIGIFALNFWLKF
jgi:NADH-quinone oxidoreductase subunit L